MNVYVICSKQYAYAYVCIWENSNSRLSSPPFLIIIYLNCRINRSIAFEWWWIINANIKHIRFFNIFKYYFLSPAEPFSQIPLQFSLIFYSIRFSSSHFFLFKNHNRFGFFLLIISLFSHIMCINFLQAVIINIYRFAHTRIYNI